MTAWRIVGFCIFGFLLLLCFVGLVTEYSWLFGGTGVYGKDKTEMNDKERDAALLKEKTKLGKLFICWSPGRNLRKIFFSPPPADNRLGVFNGV